jgi:hypothetical protein
MTTSTERKGVPFCIRLCEKVYLIIVSAICRGGLYALPKNEYDEGESHSHLWIPGSTENGRG